MKRSYHIIMLSVAFVLVGSLSFLGGVFFTMESRFPSTISHVFSDAPDAGPGLIYPASSAVLWLLSDSDVFGHHELRYILHITSSTGDREYESITFSPEDVGAVIDASRARFDWDTEKPCLDFQIGDFCHHIDLGEMLSVHSKLRNF
jgi:hypothetical protein